MSAAPTSDELYKEHFKKLTDQLTEDPIAAAPARGSGGIDYVYRKFFTYGPAIDYNSSTSGNFGRAATTYQMLMTTSDGNGQARSYLATEENFGVLKDLETRNLVVPLVGDFAGPKAIRSVGKVPQGEGCRSDDRGILPVERGAVPGPERRLAVVLQQRREPAR